MRITWLSQGSFLFESNGKRILIDPYMSDYLEIKDLKRLVKFPLSFEELKPDILICTHIHHDHLDPETVSKIAELYPECIIAGPESCCDCFRKLGVDEKNIQLQECDKTLSVGEINITPVFAEHTTPHAVGLVVEADGKKVYMSGDSEYDEKLINSFTTGSDLVLICINGRLGNMSFEEALKVVECIKPEMALPMHYGLFAANTADPEPFVQACLKSGVKSFEMTLGEAFEI